jgi:putative MFS transporter
MTDLPRSVQSYIDQTPAWPDGTPTGFIPMTAMQWRIWLLASAGKFFEGLVVFMTGVALPLIVKDFGLSPAEKGIVGAAPLAGIMVGAVRWVAWPIFTAGAGCSWSRRWCSPCS